MFAEEWPLMMFTMFAQLAIGTFIMLMIAKTLISKKGQNGEELTSFGFTAIGPVTLVALLLSVFHLGDPFGAYRAILNVGSSWLSREILTTGGFFVLWFAYWLGVRKNKGNSLLGWLTALIGVAAIFSMGGAYSSSVRVAWADINTFIAFWGTTLAMGTLGAVSSIAIAARGKNLTGLVGNVLKNVSFVGVLAVVIPLIYLPIFLSGLDAAGAAQASAQVVSDNMVMVVIRFILSLAGTLMLAASLIQQVKHSKGMATGTVLMALLLVIAGEFIGRYLFYSYGVSPIIG